MIAISQRNIRVGDIEGNTERFLRDIDTARKSWASILVGTELMVSGYMAWDAFEDDAWVEHAENQNQRIIEATRDSSLAVIWGNIKTDPSRVNEDGRMRKYNAAFIAQNGVLVPTPWGDHIPKTLMPNYGKFDDKRHFASGKDIAFEEGYSIHTIGEKYMPIELLMGDIRRKVGILICEDMWDDDYPLNLAEMYKKNGADLLINISASPAGIDKERKREQLITRHSQWVEFVYANNTGIQNNNKWLWVFDGASLVMQKWKKVFQAPRLEEWVFLVDALPELPTFPNSLEKLAENLVYWLREYMRQIGQKKLVLGLSGGIDSALVAMLAVEALWRENVIAVNMPSEYNSDTTKNLARDLATELGISYQIMSIGESVDHTKKQLREVFGIQAEGVVEENIHARDRWGRILPAVAALHGAVFSCNGNKTECATGYYTLDGDGRGFFAPIADLYKTQVNSLARYFAQKRGIPTLEKITGITPSAELSRAQAVDEGKWDPFFFEYHDRLLYQFIEGRKNPEDILRAYQDWKLENMIKWWSYDTTLDNSPKNYLSKSIVGEGGYFPNLDSWITDLERIWRLWNTGSVFKSGQSPMILSVSRRALGYDLRRSQMQMSMTDGYTRIKKEILWEA